MARTSVVRLPAEVIESSVREFPGTAAQALAEAALYGIDAKANGTVPHGRVQETVDGMIASIQDSMKGAIADAEAMLQARQDARAVKILNQLVRALAADMNLQLKQVRCPYAVGLAPVPDGALPAPGLHGIMAPYLKPVDLVKMN